jgi:hypothetical protein
LGQNCILDGHWSFLWCIHAPLKNKTLWREYVGVAYWPQLGFTNGMWGVQGTVLFTRRTIDMCSFNVAKVDVCGTKPDWEELLNQECNNLIMCVMYFFDICRNETSDVAGTVAMIVWCIWSNQKNCVWNSLKDTPKSVVMCGKHTHTHTHIYIYIINEWRADNIRQ